jgi:hypothetical protein
MGGRYDEGDASWLNRQLPDDAPSLHLIGRRGAVADDPDRMIRALVRLAVADGAEREEWMAKAARALGATELRVETHPEEPPQVLAEMAKEIEDYYRGALAMMFSAIRQRIAEEEARTR